MKLRLKYWRERRALAIRDLSDKAGVSSSTIVAIEKTDDAPRPNVTRRLAAALDITVDDLIDKPADEAIAAANAAWEASKNEPEYDLDEIMAEFEKVAV